MSYKILFLIALLASVLLSGCVEKKEERIKIIESTNTSVIIYDAHQDVTCYYMNKSYTNFYHEAYNRSLGEIGVCTVGYRAFEGD